MPSHVRRSVISVMLADEGTPKALERYTRALVWPVGKSAPKSAFPS